MKFLGIDVGTTNMKCGVYDEAGNLLYLEGREYGTKRRELADYIDVENLVSSAKELLLHAYEECPYDTIAVSSLGESFVLLDSDDNVLFLPMLYTDARGKEEAESVSSHLDELYSISGVAPQGMYSAYKLAWIKNNAPDLYKKGAKAMLVAEYLGYVLTGIRAADYASCSRTGVFDVKNKTFSKRACDILGIDVELFGNPVKSGSIVGQVVVKGLEKVTLVAGGHDQICASIGAGAVEEGACSDGMGTVECITAVYQKPFDEREMAVSGYPNVPFAVDGLYASYLLNYTCGSSVEWWREVSGYKEAKDFFALENEFERTPTRILALPYFAGAATPYQNIDAKGALIGLTLNDGAKRIYQAILEGLCYEMKLNLEKVEQYGVKPTKLIATGGCSKSKAWLQMKADVIGLPVYPLKSREAGICGAAVLGAHALTGESIDSLVKRFVSLGEPYLPDERAHAEYEETYRKYRTLYETIKNII